MAAPVLVRAYPGDPSSAYGSSTAYGRGSQALPPISSYAFADILRSADCADFQQAIDGIAEICAKNRMSLADEHSSHLPPLGEITAASSAAMRPHLLRPGMRRALTSVPEGSSGSSEGSNRSKKRRSGLFGFRKQQVVQSQPMRKMRIGSMGRSVSVIGTTALGSNMVFPQDLDTGMSKAPNKHANEQRRATQRRPSEATSSLQRLLSQNQNSQGA